MVRTYEEDRRLFWSRVDKGIFDCECSEWTLSVVNKGYGQCWFQGKRWYVHRLAYHLYYNIDIDKNIEIHHKCHNKKCCNPLHLKALSKSIHASSDSANAQKTVCKNGHVYAIDTTYVTPNGSRACRACKKLSQRKYNGFQGNKPNKEKTHCKNGHEFNKQNTYQRLNGDRSCRKCKQESKIRCRVQNAKTR